MSAVAGGGNAGGGKSNGAVAPNAGNSAQASPIVGRNKPAGAPDNSYPTGGPGGENNINSAQAAAALAAEMMANQNEIQNSNILKGQGGPGPQGAGLAPPSVHGRSQSLSGIQPVCFLLDPRGFVIIQL